MRALDWKKVVIVGAVLFALVSVGAFATSPAEETDGGAMGPVNADGEPLRIASVDWPQFQPYKVRQEAIARAAEDYGVTVDLLQPPGVTVDAAIETIENAITQGYDAIIMEAWSYEPYLEVIARATSMGIPLVSVHVPYQDTSLFISNQVIDNDGFGIAAADKIAEVTGGQANVLIMMNSPDISNQATIRQSFIDRAADKWPGVKVVDTQFTNVDPVVAARVFESALTARPEIDVAMWLESGTVTVGATVAKEMGVLDQIKIIGIDDPPDLIDSIRSGEVWGSFNQNFQKEGYEAVRTIVDYFEGNEFPQFTDCGIVLISPENVDDYVPSMWEPVALKGEPYPNLD